MSHIDSLAQDGACLTSGYASSATSTPSRYALMRGGYYKANVADEDLK